MRWKSLQLHIQNSPFSQEQVDLLNQLIPTLTTEQKIWISGFLAASQATASTIEPLTQQPTQQTDVAPVSKEITILYGSQTGNGQSLSEEFGLKLESKGFKVAVSSMSEYKPKELKNLSNLLIVASTHGEGDPPDNALSFIEFLNGRKAPRLENLHYSVLALGDTSYEFFCKTGKDIDQRLEELGGKRLYPRVDCDVDFTDDAEEWFEGVFRGISDVTEANSSGDVAVADTQTQSAEQTAYSRTNPFHAEVLENLNLNGRGSNKETRHIELSLEGSGLTYEPGDSLGIFPLNDVSIVDELLRVTGYNPELSIQINKQGDLLSLREALISHYEITVLSKPLLEKFVPFVTNEELKSLLDPEHADELRTYLSGRDLIDLVNDYGPIQADEIEFTSILRKIPPRLYSIASSYEASPDEVHLTIGALRYESHGRDRAGVCSVQCAERLDPGDTVPVFIQRNQNFKLPEGEQTPVIMVGPGTGVAPFRSFIQDREERDVSGESWLFFGEQHFMTDFLYQTEWLKWLEDGVLTKLDVAFSRDQEQKIYVQHKMLEHKEELFRWLEAGAVVYVCGDEAHMAHDVHATLLSILQTEGGLTSDQAESYLADMQQQKRYQRDVY